MNFDPVTYNEVQQLRAHFALIYGSSEALAVLLGTSLTPASFATWLAGPGKPALFAQLVNSPVGAATMIATPAAMAAVLASSVAMQSVIASSVAVSQIFASAPTRAVFKGSKALTTVNIPTMTGPTTPSGEASASSSYASALPWKAFDKSAENWYPMGGSAQWLQYKFAAPAYIHSASIKSVAAGNAPRNFRIEYSDDGAAWGVAAAGVNPSGTAVNSFDVVAAGKHLYWRLFVIDNYGAGFIDVEELTLTGFS